MQEETLRFLDFDYSEDEHGHGSFDAMAAVAPRQWPALEAEVVHVLDWAHERFGPPAPLEEGGDWDYELRGVREVATALEVTHRPGAGRLQLRDDASEPPRVTLTLTVTGTQSFCAAWREAFLTGA